VIGQAITVAFSSIATQKLRSLLTMLGVIIGVAAVIALVSLANGALASTTSQIQGLGSNVIAVDIGAQGFGPTSATGTAAPTSLTVSQAAILVHDRGVVGAAPVMAGSGTLAVGSTSGTAGVVGTSASYAQIMGYRVRWGRFLSPLDVASGQNVVVLGSAEATDLFGGVDPVGNSLTIDGVPFQVIGVLESKGSTFGQNQDSFVAIPWTTAQGFFGDGGITQVYLSAAKGTDVTSLVNRLDEQLLNWLTTAEDFNVTSQSQILSTISSVTSIFTTLLAGIASISLVVGGIGIMNIMLVSVTERTREIGIRKSVGASRGAVLLQFLVEALVLAGLGGLLGILVGWSVSALLGKIIGVGASFSPGTAALAFGVSLAIGVVFGLWPASRAAALRPVDALRVD